MRNHFPPVRTQKNRGDESMQRISLFGTWLIVVTLLLVQGCATPARLPAVPPESTTKAEIPGMPGVRYVAGGDMSGLSQIAVDSIRKEQEFLAKQGHRGPLPPAVYVAISGGGDNGAYAAGLLNGWTAAGTRPEFKLVTGISTGALIAPFAFLGPKYDATLKQVYTTISPKDVLVHRNLFTGVMGDAMADNTPLWNLTRQSVNADLLKKIAAEYAKGRFLLVATADLDARRALIWDMGKIASYGTPQALDLFVNVMMASASLPVAFPPVLIDVQVDGQHYQEMHVDGGVMAQVFAYPASIKIKEEEKEAGISRVRKLYVIRNARLDPDWAQVERQTLSIAGRAVASLIQTQGIGDLYRIYATAQRDGVDFNLTFIPPTFNAPHKEEFDNEYMRKLYDVGYDFAVKGLPWAKVPPGFVAPTVTKK
jgi:predicted patatin/cPLA2 family phospholipase